MATRKTQQTPFGVIVGVLFGFAVLAGLCGIVGLRIFKMMRTEAPRAEAERQVWVRTVPVVLGTIERRIRATGTIEPWEEVKISSKLPGKVNVVTVEEGDSVSAGQVLIELDTTEMDVAMRQMLAALAAARATMVQGDLALKNQEREFERTKGLFEEALISEQQFQGVETMLCSTRAQVEMAKTGVAQAEAGVELTETRIKDAKIASPISGIVVTCKVNPGEIISPTLPLIRVMDLSRVKVIAEVPETEVSDVKEDAIGDVTLVGAREVKMEGQVYSISPAMEPGTHSYKVTLEVRNPDPLVKAGMSALVDIMCERRENVPVVPKNTITRMEDECSIYVVDPKSIARFRPVRVLAEDGVLCQVEGVDLGEQVILQGSTAAVDGTKVVVRNVEEGGVSSTPVPADSSEGSNP